MNSYKQWREFKINNNLSYSKEFYEQFKNEYNFILVEDNKIVANKRITGKCLSCNNDYTKLFNAFTNSGPFCKKCIGNLPQTLKDTYPHIYEQIYSVPDNIDISTLTISSNVKVIWKCNEICSKCKEFHKYEQSIRSKINSFGNCLICLGRSNCECMTEDEFKCYECKKIKHISEQVKRSKDNSLPDKNFCKTCCSKQYDDNLYAFIKNLVNTSKNRTIKRNKKGKNHEYNITTEFLLSLYEQQEGKCYFSGIPLIFKSCSKWQCSLERIDNNIGYVEGNVCLICIEFQHGMFQWTKDNWNEFCNYYLYCYQNEITSFEHELLESNLEELFTKKTSVNENYGPIIKQDNKLQCKICENFYEEKDMVKNGKIAKCKKCRLEYEKSRKNTLKGKLKELYNRMTYTSKERSKKKTAIKRNIIKTLTFEELVEIYTNQNGKCYYSNIPLFFSGEYMMSAERLDVFKGYTKENTVLINVKLNIADYSVTREGKSDSNGWTKERLNYAVSLNSNAKPLKITLEDVFKSN